MGNKGHEGVREIKGKNSKASTDLIPHKEATIRSSPPDIHMNIEAQIQIYRYTYRHRHIEIHTHRDTNSDRYPSTDYRTRTESRDIRERKNNEHATTANRVITKQSAW